MIHHVNKLNNKNYMIISTDTEKAFDKFNTHFWLKKKKLQKNGHIGNLYNKGNIIKAIYDKPKASQVVLCQEAFNRRLPVCCFGAVKSPLFLINSWYSGIERRGKPLPGLTNPCISFISFSIQWKVTIYDPLLIWIAFWPYGLYCSLLPW